MGDAAESVKYFWGVLRDVYNEEMKIEDLRYLFPDEPKPRFQTEGSEDTELNRSERNLFPRLADKDKYYVRSDCLVIEGKKYDLTKDIKMSPCYVTKHRVQNGRQRWGLFRTRQKSKEP